MKSDKLEDFSVLKNIMFLLSATDNSLNQLSKHSK